MALVRPLVLSRPPWHIGGHRSGGVETAITGAPHMEPQIGPRRQPFALNGGAVPPRACTTPPRTCPKQATGAV
jgi:hypothetical protein